MKFAKIRPDGAIDSFVLDFEMPVEAGYIFVEVDNSLDGDLDRYRYIDGYFVDIGERPSRHHQYDGDKWVDPRPDTEKNAEALEELRQLRNAKLRETDWTQLPDAALTEQERIDWSLFRQKLRDLPQKYANITSINLVTFPTKD